MEKLGFGIRTTFSCLEANRRPLSLFSTVLQKGILKGSHGIKLWLVAENRNLGFVGNHWGTGNNNM
jgi:hypothetical protein